MSTSSHPANGGVPILEDKELAHGSVVIAAITSRTNTSNPSMMLAVGLLAKKAVESRPTTKAHVRTSLSPGSPAVSGHLREAGLMEYLEALGFHLPAYGCAVCIRNSGPLPESVSRAINDEALVATAVLSGNRNFEGRSSPVFRAANLASPLLVVAYALAGTLDIDLTSGHSDAIQTSRRASCGTFRPAGTNWTRQLGRHSHQSCSGNPTQECSRAMRSGDARTCRRGLYTHGTLSPHTYGSYRYSKDWQRSFPRLRTYLGHAP